MRAGASVCVESRFIPILTKLRINFNNRREKKWKKHHNERQITVSNHSLTHARN